MSLLMLPRFSRLGSLSSLGNPVKAGGGESAPQDDSPRLRRVGSLSLDRTQFGPSLEHARFKGMADLQALARGSAIQPGVEAWKAVQQSLLDLGFAVDGGVDGLPGRGTSQAIRNFQASQTLPITGQLDASTLKRLASVAPAAGLKAWEDPALPPGATLPPEKIRGKFVAVVIGVGQHRAFHYDAAGKLQKIYPIASGAPGSSTDKGLKVITGKNSDPSEIARRLWPESQGRAFGTRLMDLSWYDPMTGKTTLSGEELHGTFDRSSIGTQASHGCMRMFNEDVEELYGKLRVGDMVKVVS